MQTVHTAHRVWRKRWFRGLATKPLWLSPTVPSCWQNVSVFRYFLVKVRLVQIWFSMIECETKTRTYKARSLISSINEYSMLQGRRLCFTVNSECARQIDLLYLWCCFILPSKMAHLYFWAVWEKWLEIDYKQNYSGSKWRQNYEDLWICYIYEFTYAWYRWHCRSHSDTCIWLRFIVNVMTT